MLHYLTHTLCENNMHIHVYFKKLTNSSLLVRSLYCSHKKKNGADSDLLGAFFLQLDTHTRINREKKKSFYFGGTKATSRFLSCLLVVLEELAWRKNWSA